MIRLGDPLSRPLIAIALDIREKRASARGLIDAAIARHDRFGERLQAYYTGRTLRENLAGWTAPSPVRSTRPCSQAVRARPRARVSLSTRSAGAQLPPCAARPAPQARPARRAGWTAGPGEDRAEEGESARQGRGPVGGLRPPKGRTGGR
jgi:hypothetical protein